MTAREEKERAALVRVWADYRELRENARDVELPELALVAVSVTTEDIPLDTEANQRVLGALGAKETHGWCRFRSVVVWSRDTAWPEPDSAGPPVFGEWTLDRDSSCRLRLISGDGPAQARVWTFQERTLSEEDPVRPGEFYALRELRGALAHRAPPGIAGLAYNVFWGAEPHEDVHALRRRFDRFAGFWQE